MKTVLQELIAFAGRPRGLSRVVGSIIELVPLGNDELAMVFQTTRRPTLVYVTAGTRVSLGTAVLSTSDLWRHRGASASVYCRWRAPGRRTEEWLLAHSIELAGRRRTAA